MIFRKNLDKEGMKGSIHLSRVSVDLLGRSGSIGYKI